MAVSIITSVLRLRHMNQTMLCYICSAIQAAAWVRTDSAIQTKGEGLARIKNGSVRVHELFGIRREKKPKERKFGTGVLKLSWRCCG